MEAMLLKRLLYFSRDRKAWVFIYLVPLGLVLLGMIVQYSTSGLVNPPALTINRALYNGGIGTSFLPTHYNDGNHYCISPEYSTFQQCYTFNDQSKFVTNIHESSQFPVVADTTSISILNTSNLIYNDRNSYKASQIGAYSILTATNFTGTSNTESLSYLIHSNYSALHGAPLYQLLMAQSVVASVSPTSTIAMSLKPFGYTYTEANALTVRNVGLISTFILLAIPWLSASFTSYVVREREVKSKHIQV